MYSDEHDHIPPAPTERRLALTVEEAANELRLGRTKTYALIKEGRLRSIEVGSRRIVPLSAILDFLDSGPSGEEVA